ncbi:MAG: hypothetical protein M1465_01405 [Candidatus Marsarchaeota archaeon]|jgi:hypothetical protein|nr:hypothetical protein [Candidatus Marsarchaeota archaeon]
MYIEVYKESELRTQSLKVNSGSPRELLRSERIAHFTSFKAEFTTTVQESVNGRLHMDIKTGMEKGSYTDLCVSGNMQAMVVLEAIKNVIALNSRFGSTNIDLYATKVKNEFKHPYDTPTLYAVLDSTGGDTTAHFKISEIKYFDFISSEERNATTLKIYYPSPFFYSKTMSSNGTHRERITTNIVLSSMEIDAHEVHWAIEKARNTTDTKVVEKQLRIDNF